MKRISLILLSMLSISILMAGCGGEKTNSPNPSQPAASVSPSDLVTESSNPADANSSAEPSSTVGVPGETTQAEGFSFVNPEGWSVNGSGSAFILFKDGDTANLANISISKELSGASNFDKTTADSIKENFGDNSNNAKVESFEKTKVAGQDAYRYTISYEVEGKKASMTGIHVKSGDDLIGIVGTMIEDSVADSTNSTIDSILASFKIG